MKALNKIKILHVVHSLHEGGLTKIVYELTRNSDNSIYEIGICCLVKSDFQTDKFDQMKVKVYQLNAVNSFQPLNGIRNLIQVVRLMKIIQSEKFDIIHSHAIFPSFLARIAALLAGVRFSFVTLHSVYSNLSFLQKMINRVLAPKTTCFIAVSKSVRNFTLKSLYINEMLVSVIYNGIDTSLPEHVANSASLFKARHRIPEHSIIIGTIANYSKKKGIDILIQSFGQVVRYHPNAILIIIGGVIPAEIDYKKYIENIIHSHKLTDNVILTGKIEDINEILYLFDIFVQPSRIEGFGLSLVEAMYSYRTCIASDISTFKEIIADYEDGFLFQNESADDLATKICTVLTFPKEEHQRIGRKAHEKALKNFTLDKMVSQYYNLYQSYLFPNESI